MQFIFPILMNINAYYAHKVLYSIISYHEDMVRDYKQGNVSQLI